MSRNTRMLLVVAIALVAATAASAGVYIAISRQKPKEVQVAATDVVVAAKPLELGVSLTKNDLRLVGWPQGNLVPGRFAKVEDVVDRGLVAAVDENEPITESKLAPRAAGAGLPPAIHPGMRAMSVKVNEVIGVAGFVVPGTKVDVLVTIHEDRGSTSRVVVSDVQVLTAGTRYDEAEAKKAGKPIPSSVVTLMVTPSDAERIALAASEGQIMLALRNPLDTGVTDTPGIKTAGLLETQTPPKPLPPLRPVPQRAARVAVVEAPSPPPPLSVPTPVRTVETIKAGKREKEIIQ